MSGPLVPRDMADGDAHRRLIAEAVNRALAGRVGNAAAITLRPAATSTTVTDARIGPNSLLVVMPTTANAAAAQAELFIVAGLGSAVLHHAASATTDRTFATLILG